MNTPIKSGFENIDKIIGGFYPSEVTYILGRPFIGKTSFLISLLNNICVENNIPSAVFAISEYGYSQVVDRDDTCFCWEWVGQLAGLGYINRMNELTLEDLKKIGKTTEKILSSPCYPPVFLGSITSDYLCKKIKNAVEQIDAKIIFIDGISGSIDDYSNIPVSEWRSKIFKKLKMLATELDIPIVCTDTYAKLRATDDSYNYENTRPTLENLNEDLTNIDTIMLLHREFPAIPTYLRAETIIAKNSHGSTGTVKMKFDNARRMMFLEETTFEDVGIK